MEYVFFKNKIIKEEKARVPLATHALQYGTGVFEGIRGYWNKNEKAIYLFQPLEHFARLLQSSKIMGWSAIYSPDEMVEFARTLVSKNNPASDIYIRPFIFQASTKLGPLLGDELQPTLAMYLVPIGEYFSTSKGLKGRVVSWRRLDDSVIPPRAKVSGTYVNSALARTEAQECGADEAIFLNHDGHVSEASSANIFIARSGVLITPPPSANILEGITRALVMEIARELGISVIERDIDRSELYIADEVFLTGTACQIVYFSAIDGKKIGSGRVGQIVKRLQEIYFKTVHNELPEYASWLVKV
ncbi:MAG: Branched-chain amino acid aminotransferase [Parcubacteria group bacterium GW2011_GWC2_44_17]|uniref:Branched-chain-amino-acid aminotransferase n=1 Tax=Candidatus Jacksonbacteria bacterium RIFCSPLOWO2_02_FULL_44_20 TaxID=1798460 RepID=A0A1G2A6X2_9BACT|nr:MAG: Branched-chain amino acid aminotransferase [Parcubacteria group bacterium GW2011_GWC2_44_17]OGY72223.1 MAG: branched-chain-amino-acid transaminase [Candidatus Jacksonbacteria bacterium RIFCSPHIGHO2_12_FULL_44_12]OGY72592.1 MAG: branched-chain-amino-acid transaminase [Candidatus Jacksonbacteria bacterium RIFCSPLOWO2_02_FULL_44_20]HCE86733.1 branched chain amino acid aminotransferase [Candidatus Jacksonbacteria bacterium]